MDWSAIGDFASALAPIVLSVLLPGVGIIVPAAVGLLVKNVVNNQAVASAAQTAAGVAYNHMADAFSRNGSITFGDAKDAAISAAVATANGVINKLPPDQQHTIVDGALGRLLASDPHFSPVSPNAPASPPAPDTAQAGGGS